MKCTSMFLVLAMVVLMAQPGEGIIGLLIHGIVQAVHGIKKLVNGKENLAEEQADQQQLDKHLFQFRHQQKHFD
uniref:Piscidin-3 n=2 Tax=Poecilia TaxID=8080 RepID=A0A3B3V2X4_9TELE